MPGIWIVVTTVFITCAVLLYLIVRCEEPTKEKRQFMDTDFIGFDFTPGDD